MTLAKPQRTRRGLLGKAMILARELVARGFVRELPEMDFPASWAPAKNPVGRRVLGCREQSAEVRELTLPAETL